MSCLSKHNRYAVVGVARSGTTAMSRILSRATKQRSVPEFFKHDDPDGIKSHYEYHEAVDWLYENVELYHEVHSDGGAYNIQNVQKYLTGSIWNDEQEEAVRDWFHESDFHVLFTYRDPYSVLRSRVMARATGIWESHREPSSRWYAEHASLRPTDADYEQLEKDYTYLVDFHGAMYSSNRTVIEYNRHHPDLVAQEMGVRLPTHNLCPVYPSWGMNDMQDIMKRIPAICYQARSKMMNRDNENFFSFQNPDHDEDDG